MNHNILNTTNPETLVEYLRSRKSNRVKLVMRVEHDEPSRRILFTLNNRHLPGEGGEAFFLYSDGTPQPRTIATYQAVRKPRPERILTSEVVGFLDKLPNEDLVEVMSFGLVQTELRYEAAVDCDDVVQTFVTACASSLSIGENDSIAVLRLL
ncbi:MAG: hypothetical protein JWO54_451 [Candidatus Saccharibacteria bacterium]|nr:hypothetical protein [Candidatus Saccharibacteria bacterium]MDB5180691.1 hypothetical protein [Candidatus Saccharibacteria bacterium]